MATFDDLDAALGNVQSDVQTLISDLQKAQSVGNPSAGIQAAIDKLQSIDAAITQVTSTTDPATGEPSTTTTTPAPATAPASASTAPVPGAQAAPGQGTLTPPADNAAGVVPSPAGASASVPAPASTSVDQTPAPTPAPTTDATPAPGDTNPNPQGGIVGPMTDQPTGVQHPLGSPGASPIIS